MRTPDLCPTVAPVPPVRRHPTGQAYCRWPLPAGGRRTRYFGRYGTPAADAAYRSFAAEWSASPPPAARPRGVARPPRPAKPPPADPCRHCGRNKAVKQSRKLCHRCIKDPAVRAAHPLVPNRFNQRGVGGPGRPLPDRPTDIPPGPGRVEVYAARVAGGFALFHPEDARD